jgi:hypothetical protein
MTSTPTPAHRTAAHHAPNTFITRFVPGLILGLLVGGLAGAFLTPIAEQGIGGGGAPAGRTGFRAAPTLPDGARGEHEQRELLPRQEAPAPTPAEQTAPASDRPDAVPPAQPPTQPPTQPK